MPVADCPKCGEELWYESDATSVACEECGARFERKGSSVPAGRPRRPARVSSSARRRREDDDYDDADDDFDDGSDDRRERSRRRRSSNASAKKLLLILAGGATALVLIIGLVVWLAVRTISDLQTGDDDKLLAEPAIPDGFNHQIKIPIPDSPHRSCIPRFNTDWILISNKLVQVRGGAELDLKAMGVTDHQNAELVISGNGRYLLTREPGGDIATLWDIQQKKSREINPDSSTPLPFMEFAGDDHFVVAYTPDGARGAVRKMRIDTGETTVDFNTESHLHYSTTTISPDGKWLAVMDNGLNLFDLSNAGQHRKNGKLGFDFRTRCERIEFSRDGRELYALCREDNEMQIRAWDVATLQSTVTLTGLPVALSPDADSRYCIQELPQQRGWLVKNRFLVLRDGGLIPWVLNIQWPFARVYPLDTNHLLAETSPFSDFGEFFVDVPVPWDRIDQAVQAMGGGGDARLRPGGGVRIAVDVERVMAGTKEALAEELENKLQGYLEGRGFVVDQGAATEFRVEYRESSGGRVEIVERQRFGQNRPTGETAETTNVRIVATLTSDGDDEPFWKKNIESRNSMMTSSDGTDEGLRRESVGRAIGELRSVGFPDYVGPGENPVTLPILAEMPE